MDAQVPPMPKFGRHIEPPMKELAAKCVNGNLNAGVSLVERLAQAGVGATIQTLVYLAVPTGRITSVQFDRLADALAASRSLQERLP
jgi:hypothetical protein